MKGYKLNTNILFQSLTCKITIPTQSTYFSRTFGPPDTSISGDFEDGKWVLYVRTERMDEDIGVYARRQNKNGNCFVVY